MTDRVVVPVEVKALLAPGTSFDLVAFGNVRIILLGLDRQVGFVVLARIIDIVEQVLHVERHDRDAMQSVVTFVSGVIVLTTRG